MGRVITGVLRIGGRVTLVAAILLLVGRAGSATSAGPLRPAGGGDLPVLSVVGLGSTALSKPPSGGAQLSVDVPGVTIARLTTHHERVARADHSTCGLHSHDRTHARGPPAA